MLVLFSISFTIFLWYHFLWIYLYFIRREWKDRNCTKPVKKIFLFFFLQYYGFSFSLLSMFHHSIFVFYFLVHHRSSSLLLFHVLPNTLWWILIFHSNYSFFLSSMTLMIFSLFQFLFFTFSLYEYTLLYRRF